jgi:hypothetical protein
MRALPRVGEPVRWMMASSARPRRAMGSSAAGGRRDPGENPKVGRLRELFAGDAAGEGGDESSLSCRLLRVGEVDLGGCDFWRLVWFGRGCLYEGWARMCVRAWALDRGSGGWLGVSRFISSWSLEEVIT